MRVVIQRVSQAEVKVSGTIKSNISEGLLILLGVEKDDNKDDVSWLSKKISGLRIFNDANGIMNLNIRDVDGDILVVSQFTLHARTKKGNRPSYINAAHPNHAIPLYELFLKDLRNHLGKPVAAGEFGAEMNINLVNSGPVTIIIDTKNKE